MQAPGCRDIAGVEVVPLSNRSRACLSWRSPRTRTTQQTGTRHPKRGPARVSAEKLTASFSTAIAATDGSSKGSGSGELAKHALSNCSKELVHRHSHESYEAPRMLQPSALLGAI